MMINAGKFPEVIEIQTTSFCNAYCVICPYSSLNPKKDFMTDQLFKKIIDEASKYQDELRIIPYLNGEPLLDKKIIERIKYINKKCPKSFVELSTNLNVANINLIDELTNLKIDDLRISIFGFTKETYEKMMPKLSWEQLQQNLKIILKKKNKSEISIVMIEHEILSSDDYELAKIFCDNHGINLNIWGFLDRASNVKGFKNKNLNVVFGKGCNQNRDSERMHITYDGDVIQCCQDWTKSNVLGNINVDSITDTWSNLDYVRHREKVNNQEMASPELCRKCKIMKR